MKDKISKFQALSKLSDMISKKTPKQMKDYINSFKGTDIDEPASEPDDDDLVKNIKKTYNKKKM